MVMGTPIRRLRFIGRSGALTHHPVGVGQRQPSMVNDGVERAVHLRRGGSLSPGLFPPVVVLRGRKRWRGGAVMAAVVVGGTRPYSAILGGLG